VKLHYGGAAFDSSGLVSDELMPGDLTFAVPCAHCGTAPKSSAARFCRRCGAALPIELVYEQRVTGWKSLPVVIRLAICLAVPVLIAGAIWVLLILAVIQR